MLVRFAACCSWKRLKSVWSRLVLHPTGPVRRRRTVASIAGVLRTAGQLAGCPTPVRPPGARVPGRGTRWPDPAVERFIEPACCPMQNGAEECHLQQRVEVQLRVRDLIHQESVHPGEAGRRIHLLQVGRNSRSARKVGSGVVVSNTSQATS